MGSMTENTENKTDGRMKRFVGRLPWIGPKLADRIGQPRVAVLRLSGVIGRTGMVRSGPSRRRICRPWRWR
jgi:hypothetical protein